MSKFEGDTKALMVVINWSAENVAVDLTSVTPDFPETGIVEASTLRKEREACTTNSLGRKQAPNSEGFGMGFLKVSLAHMGSMAAGIQPNGLGSSQKHFINPFGQFSDPECMISNK